MISTTFSALDDIDSHAVTKIKYPHSSLYQEAQTLKSQDSVFSSPIKDQQSFEESLEFIDKDVAHAEFSTDFT
jgi:hypothetical protein